MVNKEMLLSLGGKEWSKNEMERVYINADIFNKLAETNFSDRTNKFFYDCKTNKMMRSYKGKKPQVEII